MPSPLPFTLLALAFLPSALAVTAPKANTPIEHVIVIVGENRSFDNLFGTYRPKKGAAVWNLLSRGIVKENGAPGPNFHLAAQKQAENKGAYTPTPKVVVAQVRFIISVAQLLQPQIGLSVPDLVKAI